MITVVIGHVCSGKTTYVLANARRGDVIIDMDRLAHAMTTDDTPDHDYPQHVADIAKAARWAAIDEAVRRHRAGGFDLWVIHAYPDEKDLAIYRRCGAAIHEVEADATTLRLRASMGRPARVRRLLEERLGGVGSPHTTKQAPTPRVPCARISVEFPQTGR